VPQLCWAAKITTAIHSKTETMLHARERRLALARLTLCINFHILRHKQMENQHSIINALHEPVIPLPWRRQPLLPAVASVMFPRIPLRQLASACPPCCSADQGLAYNTRVTIQPWNSQPEPQHTGTHVDHSGGLSTSHRQTQPCYPPARAGHIGWLLVRERHVAEPLALGETRQAALMAPFTRAHGEHVLRQQQPALLRNLRLFVSMLLVATGYKCQ
jgi:hypothetical protein